MILLFVACGSAYQSAPPQGIGAGGDKVIDTIHSRILKEDRFIWVHLPSSAQNAPSKKYPVIFLFDAEANFDATKNIIDKLSKEPSSKSAGEVILVGIGNIWLRYRDYSPSHVSSSPWLDASTSATTGGGDAFISFLEKELLPFIEKKYPASPNRTLVGHSMGGLQAINILLKHPHLFDNYIAIDPSLWWDEQKLINESATILHHRSFDHKRLFLAIANEEQKRMTMEQVRKDTSAKTALIRPSFLLADLIEKNKQNKLWFEWKFYKDDHHMTVNGPATYDAIRSIKQ